jgi:SnoaL-like domain
LGIEISPVEICRRFVESINVHDLDGLGIQLPPEHRFVDSLGVEVRGRDTVVERWRQYFRMVPDYRVEVARSFSDGPEVLLLGVAHGTYTADGKLEPGNSWSTPGVWRALIREGLVAEWQVYADNEPIRRCIARAST